MFLTIDDFKSLIKDEVLQAVINNDRSILDDVLMMAQSEIESYINQRYDVVNIFNKVGDLRHPLIRMYMIDIVLYHIHARINPKFIPDIRVDRYNTAISWLTKVARGELTPDLPPRVVDEDNIQAGLPSRWGSHDKYNHRY